MSLKTILSTLILASSSVALAQPMVRDHRDTNSITIAGGLQASVGFSTSPSSVVSYQYGSSYDRYDNDRFDRRDHSRWGRGGWQHNNDYGREILLAPAAEMSLSNDGNAYHTIDSNLRVMSLELDGLGGTQYVDYLVLQLADGTNRTVYVRRQLDARTQKLTVNLGSYGMSLRGVGVYGSSPTRTALQITGITR